MSILGLMIFTYSIILNTENGKREILISPFCLQAKQRPDLKSGKINKLFFYDHCIDEKYKENLKREHLDDKFRSDDYLINYGQDFGNYYLGYFNIDFDSKSYWGWEGEPGKLNDNEVKALGESLFNENIESRHITIFTPTRPFDINFGIR